MPLTVSLEMKSTLFTENFVFNHVSFIKCFEINKLE